MKLGSLFSGGGLGDFGFMAAGMDIAWQCEIDEYCQKILSLRYPESKKYHDIKTLKGAVHKIWPTPVAQEWGQGVNPRATGKKLHIEALSGQTTGSLNPQWVEWLMGLPIGYTDLKCSETAKSLLAHMLLEK